MSLLTAHRILIASAIAAALLFAAWATLSARAPGGVASGITAAASVLVAAGLALYYRTIGRGR